MTRPALSFEFFPPKGLNGSFRLWDAVRSLSSFDPKFVSVTYGAGGSTRDATHEVLDTLHNCSDLRVAGHLTCVEATKAETLKIADEFAEAGVTDIVALRGDAPEGQDHFTAHPDGYKSSVELIADLAAKDKFNIHVASYPETHPEARSREADIEFLKRKFDAGAATAITQFFFEADTYFRFRDDCADAGITAPIIPGILPVENWNGVRNFAAKCGTSIPATIAQAFQNAQRDGTHQLLATAVAAELCDELIEGGVDHLHFYTLNRAELTRDTCLALGCPATRPLQNVA